MTASRAARFAAIILVLTTILFGIGVTAEDEGHEAAESAEDHTQDEPTTHDESSEEGETAEGAEADEHEEGTEAEGGENNETGREAAEHDEEGEERELLGVDLESPWLLAVGIALSLALAAALWFVGDHRTAVVAIAFGVGFAALDLAEVVHQLDEDRTGIASLAIAVTIGHLATAVLAGISATRTS